MHQGFSGMLPSPEVSRGMWTTAIKGKPSKAVTSQANALTKLSQTGQSHITPTGSRSGNIITPIYRLNL